MHTRAEQETVIHPENPPIDTIEHRRAVPLISGLLNSVEDHFGPASLPMIFTVANHVFPKAYSRWETVRLERSGEIIGNPQLATGAEGYAVGLSLPAQEILNLEARIGQDLLNKHVLSHPFEQNLRRQLERLYQGEASSSYAALGEAIRVFQDFRFRMQQIPMPPEGRIANALFRQKTQQLVHPVPPMQHEMSKGTYTHTLHLPKLPENGHTASRTNKEDIPSDNKDGYLLVHRLGVTGHPIIRLALHTPILASVLLREHAHLPPKGTPSRNRMEAILIVWLTEQLDKLHQA